MADYIKELRARIGHMRIVIPGVRGILVDDERRVLLQRRADSAIGASRPASSMWATRCLPHSPGRFLKRPGSPSSVLIYSGSIPTRDSA